MILVLVLLFLVAVIVIYISGKKKRETEFLLATVLFTYGSGTVQNRVFGGIRYQSFFFLKGNDVLNRTSDKSLAPIY